MKDSLKFDSPIHRNYHGVHMNEFFELGVIHNNMGEALPYNASEPLWPVRSVFVGPQQSFGCTQSLTPCFALSAA